MPTNAAWSTPSLATNRPIEQIYDARRDCSIPKPRLRGRLHLIWFILGAAVGPIVVLRADGTTRSVALAVYVATLLGLFGTSALYHCGRWSASARDRLRRLDQAMILFMIAGTATPEFLLALAGPAGQIATGSMWFAVLALTAIKLAWPRAPEKLAGAAFLLLGWFAGLALPAVWVRFGVAPVVLISSGGVLYTVGAIVYHRRRPDPIPAVFGYHEVFHACVCLAATAQFIAITVFTV